MQKTKPKKIDHKALEKSKKIKKRALEAGQKIEKNGENKRPKF